ncbi:unnamed protein product [Mytilus coruscus]|uniref:Uncharacterized protein n=1 Tax=Mytilus coruscus TaxID=42192 RepID=A0A6J8DXF6_MYTCO|nr:unnamed protein product [Mytilus coruscus]
MGAFNLQVVCFSFVDVYQHCDLGAHQNFVESSKALIKNTNARLDRLNTMSNDLRRLASLIKDDRDEHEESHLSPEIKAIGEINKDKQNNKTKRQSINIVIPIDGPDTKGRTIPTEKTQKLTKPKISPKKNTELVNKKGKEATGLHKQNKIDIKKLQNHTEKNNTFVPNLFNKGQRREYDETYDEAFDNNKRTEIQESISESTSPDLNVSFTSTTRQHCCLFHKYGYTDAENKRRHKEEIREPKTISSTPTQIKAHVVDLSLPSRSKFLNFDRSNDMKKVDCYQLGLCKTSTSSKFKYNSRETIAKSDVLRRQVLLPKRITLHANSVSELFTEGSVLPLDKFSVGFRFRIGQKSKTKHENYITRLQYSSMDYSLVLKSSGY